MEGGPGGSTAGLYLHIPFCSAICPYCDFAVVKGGAERRRAFVESLRTEMTLYSDHPVHLDTIYFGGGTPSALDFEALHALLVDVRRTFRAASSARVFLEVNPEDVSEATVESWRSLGVGTLSLGVQSFDDRELRFLGRRHDSRQARRAVELSRAGGFPTVSIDLIYGLPDQSSAQWARNLEVAIALDLDHLSCYQLSVHDRTPFGRRRGQGRLVELRESEQARLFEQTHRRLAEAGLPAYEVSNFARGAEHRSRHNQKYWYHVPYLGLGPSAHSFAGRERWWNHRELEHYEESLSHGQRPVAGREQLTDQQLALEALMLGLRTTAGVDLARFRDRYHVDLVARNERQLRELEKQGLLLSPKTHLALTLSGLAIADAVAATLEVDPCEG